MERFTERIKDGGTRLNIADYGEPPYPVVTNEFVERLAEYEDIGATPDELKTAVYLYLEMNQKMKKIVKDMKWYLDANEEDGVVYIPKFVIEEIVYSK